MDTRFSNIEWTDVTWNVAVGCTKVSPGCKHCYMMRDFGGRFSREVNGTVTRTKPGTFLKPLNWQAQKRTSPDGRRMKVFTSSLTDVFHPAIDEYRDEIWEIIRGCPDLDFQILTKRPERVLDNLPGDFSPEKFPNVWMGVSVESQDQLERIEILGRIPARVKFASFEPLIGFINMDEFAATSMGVYKDDWRMVHRFRLDWAIIGGESGNDSGPWGYRPCELDWIKDLVDQLDMRGVKTFVKQTGTHLAKELGISRHGKVMEEWPEQIQIREFPEQYR